jgi:hypothetical protein
MFHDWLIHTRGLVKSGFTGIDLYLERAKKLTLSEREMLGMMNDSVMTLFEVRVSRSRDKLVFNDLLLNYGRIEQPSPEMVDPLEKSVMGARVIHFSHGPALGIGYFPFMHDMKTLLLETLREYFADYQKAVPTATMETFLKNENPVVGLFLEIMRALKVAEEEVENEESEVTFNMSIFDVIDYRAAKKSIQKLPRLHECQKDTFEWYSDDSEDPELLGTVLIAGGEMILAAVSEEMREAGKLMLRSACRTSIRHREDSIRTVSPDEM